MKKTELQKEGFDPEKVKNDQLYYLDLKAGKYLLLDSYVYQQICNGAIRL